MSPDLHTLVIPTFNRPALLKRLVTYYHRHAQALNLLVLDSSRPEIATENEKALAFYGSALRHVVFPDTTPMAVKLAQGLEQVQTPYASFCADDDIVFPEGIRLAIGYLEGRPEYVSAHGRYLNFQQNGRDIRLWLEYAGPGNEAGHAGARIFRLFQRYESLFYGMFRTLDLREIFAGVAALPTLHYQELFQAVAALIKGKVHRFKDLYAARQSGEAAEPERTRWQTYYWFVDDTAEMLEHYGAYRAQLWGFYQAHAAEPRLSEVAFVTTLDLAHAVYFSANCPPEYFYSRLQQYWPDDPYVDPNKPGLLDWQNFSYDVPRMGIGHWLRMAHFAIRNTLGRRRMMEFRAEMRDVHHSRWRFRLPANLRSLATDPTFRSTYLELCTYLDAD